MKKVINCATIPEWHSTCTNIVNSLNYWSAIHNTGFSVSKKRSGGGYKVIVRIDL